MTIHQFNGGWGGSDYRAFSVNAGGTSYQDFRIGRPGPGPLRRINEVEFYTQSKPNIIVTENNFVGINIENPTEKLHVDGNILATGSITPDYVFEKYYNGESILKPEYTFEKLENRTIYKKTQAFAWRSFSQRNTKTRRNNC